MTVEFTEHPTPRSGLYALAASGHSYRAGRGVFWGLLLMTAANVTRKRAAAEIIGGMQAKIDQLEAHSQTLERHIRQLE